ncbi:hypothetical protein Gpo141_00006262 [Globisporangium polare]
MTGSPTATDEVRVDFLRGASSIHVDSTTIDKPAALAASTQPPNSRQDYVTRRMNALFPDADATSVELGAISQLPLTFQVAFRVKMLSIFALQLLFVGALVGACAYVPQVTDQLKARFQGQIAYLVGAGVGVVLLLVLLYFIRALFPLNWLVLLLFSVAQALLLAILGIKFDTNIGVFNCGATFSCVVIMILLSGLRRRAPNEEPKLLSPIAAGFIAYVVVALVSTGLFIKLGKDFVTAEGFGASLGFQFMLIMWFAIDAASMCRVMSPDEYMHGVLYFYTDMILLVVMCAVAVGVGALVALCNLDDCIAVCLGCLSGCSDAPNCQCNCFETRCCQSLGRCCESVCETLCRPCCNDKRERETPPPPPVDDRERFPPGSAYHIPEWEEFHKNSAADESVNSLEMQRV